MAYEQRDNSGVLFKNERKEKDSHPDYEGTIMVAGRKMRLAAWIKTGQSGKKFMSLSVKDFDRDMQQRNDRVEQGKKSYANKDIDDAIPF